MSSIPEGARLAGAARKALQAAGIWLPALLALAAIRPAALHFAPLWMGVGVSLLSNVLQPAYSPFEGSRTPEDRGTAAQVLWTVYLTQAAALLELAWRGRHVLPLDPVAWLAFAAMSAGLALRTWAVIALGPWFTWNLTVQRGQLLVRRGPYRCVRHPSYLGALISFVAFCVLLRSWAVTGIAAIALTLVFLRRIRYEEVLLSRKLAGYRAYASRTGRLLPRIL